MSGAKRFHTACSSSSSAASAASTSSSTDQRRQGSNGGVQAAPTSSPLAPARPRRHVTTHPPPTFELVSTHSEDTYTNFYGCAICPYQEEKEVPYGVAVGGTIINLYKFPPETRKIILEAKLELNLDGLEPFDIPYEQAVGVKEILYTVTWCLDEQKHIIVCAGARGCIYIVDSATMNVKTTLLGHTDAVNDIRTSPKNTCIVATASTDHSVRIFHIKEMTCLFILFNAHAHIDTVLSVDWSTDATALYSGGVDHKVVVWDLSTPEVQEHMDRCLEKIAKDEPVGSLLDRSRSPSAAEACLDLEGHTLFTKTVAANLVNIHQECVDCVRAIELGGPYIVSKATGAERRIKLSRAGDFKKADTLAKRDGKSDIFMWSKRVEDGEQYFSKLEVSPEKRWIAVCGGKGSLHIYDGKNQMSNVPYCSVRLNHQYQVHDVSFHRSGQLLMVASSFGYVARVQKKTRVF